MTAIQASLRAQRIAAAAEKFKIHPRFASVQLQLHERSLKLGEKFPPPIARLSKEGFDCAIAWLSIHADAYLTMVDDMAYQDAYASILDSIARQAWMQFSGIPLEQLATPEDYRPFQQIVAHWKAEGYRKLSALKAPDATPPPRVHVPTKARQRREPNPALLENKETVNHEQAAQALGISERTLDRWIIDGTVTPVGPATRKRFRSKDLLKILGKKNSDN